MGQAELDDRHRDRNGEISRKHGNTRVGTLRKIYGAAFAQSFTDDQTLSDALQEMDAYSLSQLVHHHERGELEGKIKMETARNIADLFRTAPDTR